jgi:hypothetical protein
MKSHINQDQIERARSVGILEYLTVNESDNIKHCGREYRLADHDSLTISNEKWYWHSQGFGDVNALEFLIKVRNIGFVDAVERLAGADYSQVKFDNIRKVSRVGKARKSDMQFNLPREANSSIYAIAYLQKRGIDNEVIQHCLSNGTFYEAMYEGNQCCVFVGNNAQSEPKFACVRGIQSEYKKDIGGSQKRYSFSIRTSEQSKILFVCESPIDAMTVATIQKQDFGEWKDNNYLSLGGVATLALEQFLSNNPHIDTLNLCLDNDEAGHKGVARMHALISKNETLKSQIKTISDLLPTEAKDYNEQLQIKIKYQNSNRNADNRAVI